MFIHAKKELAQKKKTTRKNVVGSTHPVQRKVVITNMRITLAQTHEQEFQRDMRNDLPDESAVSRFSRLYNYYINDSKERNYTDKSAFIGFMNTQIGYAASAEDMTGQMNGQTWFDAPDTEGIIELNQQDPLYISIKNAVLHNAQNASYPTDPKHEVVPSSPSPKIEITRIQMIKNPTQRQQYEAAKREIHDRNGEIVNEAHLFSGHGEKTADIIVTQGHRPDLGTYGGDRFYQKGHGALGRGAYFTDTVLKAVSYSRAPNRDSSSVQKPDDGTEHSFLLQDVLLGNALYGNYFPFRHAHLNEMVRDQRSNANKKRDKGTAAPNINDQQMSEFDSIISAKTHQPGEGYRGVLDRAINGSFDSNEYLIRNADQVCVRFRVFYKLLCENCDMEQAQGQGQDWYPITQIGNIEIKKSAEHLPKSWLGRPQKPFGQPIVRDDT